MLLNMKIGTAEEASIIDSTTNVLPGNVSTSVGLSAGNFIDNSYNSVIYSDTGASSIVGIVDGTQEFTVDFQKVVSIYTVYINNYCYNLN